ETSRQATIEAIGKLRKGSYRNSLTMDGYDRPLTLAAEMTIGEDGIHVDYAGTSPASAFGINVVLNYTTAYTAFGVKCLVAPEVPNNAGSLAPITVSAPEGCLLNAKRPRAVRAVPVEATGAVAPVLFRRRGFREGSGGAGQFRGGLGQIIGLGGADGTPIAMLCNFERIGNPARGRDGGGIGALGQVSL